jgi:pimeloyl-ACP methyl ester carboxylesterase
MPVRTIPATDGTPLSVRVTGKANGTPVLLCDGIGCDGYVWRYLKPALEPTCRVVHYHYRGHGQSATPADLGTLTVAQCAADGWSVIDALGLGRTVLVGHSMGVQVILDAARQRPDHVKGLVPICGAFERPLDTFAGSDIGLRLLPHVTGLAASFPDRLRQLWAFAMPTEFAYRFAAMTELNVAMLRRDDFLPYLKHMGCMDPLVFLRYVEDVAQHSARSWLASIAAPVLVIGGERDGFTPPKLARELANLVPHGEVCIVPGGSHAATIELPELVELRVAEFARKWQLW